MARIPYAENIEAMAGGIKLINLYKMLGHSPMLAMAIGDLGSTIFTKLKLSSLERELIILLTGLEYSSEYEWDQHVPISKVCGVTEDQRVALKAKEYGSSCFDDRQKALLKFSLALMQSPTVEDKLFSETQKHFTNQEIVEIIVVATKYFMIARITTVLEVDLDLATDASLLDQAAKRMAAQKKND